jgi:hypothetical protein
LRKKRNRHSLLGDDEGAKQHCQGNEIPRLFFSYF